MRRMLFTTVAITAMLAAGPSCHNNKPKITTPPAVENVKRTDTMGDAEKKLQGIPKKIEGTKADTAKGELRLESAPPPIEIRLNQIKPPAMQPKRAKPIVG